MAEIVWQGPEFEYHEKGPLWEAIVVIVAAVVIALSLIFQRNFLFAVFIAFSAGTMIFWGRRRPLIVECLLDDGGLTIKGRVEFHFSELSEFAVSPYPVADGNFAELVLHRKGAIRGPVKLFVPLDSIEEIREHLRNYLVEFDYEPSLSEQVARLLKF